MSDETFHLTAERIQALLDGQLPDGDAARAREHVDACARCRAQVEAWELVFADLSDLPELAPTFGFADRVLDALPEREAAVALPWVARARGWLGLDPARDAAHPTGARLQDVLDGRVRGRRAAAVDAHLRGCVACRHEMEGLARVVSGLERLPRLAPSAEFADRVMASVTVPEPAPAAVRAGRLLAARAREVLSLRTRRAWAAVAGAAVAPAVVVGMVAWAVFSHPLVTLSSLATFLWIQGSELAGAGASWLTGTALENPVLFRAWSALEGLSVAPTTAAAGFLGFSALMVVALWVLYVNLFAPHAVEGRYAKLQV